MTKIFVEGKDKVFIEFLLKNMFDSEKLEAIQVISTNGWTNLPIAKNQFIQNTDQDGVNLIIFDADDNFATRQTEILAMKKKLNIQFDLFLFPNNSDNGDYESLLEGIINPKHTTLFNCFQQYENCIAQHKDENGQIIYQTPIRKAKIYSYIDAFKLSRAMKEKIKKGDYLFENAEIWDTSLTCEALYPIRAFLAANMQ
jgi:hypothetical protein